MRLGRHQAQNPQETDQDETLLSPEDRGRAPSTAASTQRQYSRRRSPVRALVGIALLLLAGAGWALLRYVDQAVVPRVLGDNYPVNEGARDPADISAHNSPMIVQNPTDPAHLAVANKIDSPRYSCAVHVSFDGGASWRQTPLPVPEGEEPRCFAPEVAFAADGTFYVLYLTLKGTANVPNAVWLVESHDGGLTLSDPEEEVLGPLSFQVRMVAHPTRPEHLYVVWLSAQEVGHHSFVGADNPISFTFSDDGGETWATPARISPPSRERVIAPLLAVGPGDQLYVTYLDIGDDRLDYEGAHETQGGPPYRGTYELVVARSHDHGATWNESVIDDRIRPAERFIVFLPPLPSLAVDQSSGTVYAAIQDARLGDADVWMWSSADGGSEWSEAVRVNDTPEGDGTSQLLPKLAAAPDGRIDVIYYDRRADPDNIMNEVSLQSSFDGGATFTERVVLSDTSFDSRIGLRGEVGMPDLGSRLGLLSTVTRSFAVWTDTRMGSEASLKQDIVRAVAAVPDRPKVALEITQAIRYGSPLMGLFGLVMLGAGVIGSRSPDMPPVADHDDERDGGVAP